MNNLIANDVNIDSDVVVKKLPSENGYIVRQITEIPKKYRFSFNKLSEEELEEKLYNSINNIKVELGIVDRLDTAFAGDTIIKTANGLVVLKDQDISDRIKADYKNMTLKISNTFTAPEDGVILSGGIGNMKIGSYDWYKASQIDYRLKVYINLQIKSAAISGFKLYHLGYYFKDTDVFFRKFTNVLEMKRVIDSYKKDA